MLNAGEKIIRTGDIVLGLLGVVVAVLVVAVGEFSTYSLIIGGALIVSGVCRLLGSRRR